MTHHGPTWTMGKSTVEPYSRVKEKKDKVDTRASHVVQAGGPKVSLWINFMKAIV